MKILVIQQKMIGDVLTSSILFEAIKLKYPDAETHYAINSKTYAVVEKNPFINVFKFITPEIETSKKKFLGFLNEIKLEQYDIVIDVYSKSSSNLMSLFSKAKTKISKFKYYTSFIYTHTFRDSKIPRTNAGLAIENRLQLLKPLNIEAPKDIRPKIHLTELEKKLASTLLKSASINLDKPLYMISAIGSCAAKTYPAVYMAELINTIVTKKKEAQILFNYIPKQESDAKYIYDLCEPSTQKQIYFDVFGKSLRDFLAITYHCDALIGNEGGAVNMAKALNVPTFTIFSPWIKKEAWSLFEDDKKNVSVHLNDFKTEFFEGKSTKELKANWKSLYEKFLPEYFTNKLKQFIKQ
jgi:heptosyltransferase-2